MESFGRKTRHGYVDTSETASDMVDEALQPYLAEMQKCQQLGLAEQALSLCMGLIAGLYQFATQSHLPFKDWSTDIPMGYAAHAVDAWKKGAPGPEDMAAMKAFLHEEGVWWDLKVG